MSRQYRPKAGFWIRLCVAILYPLDGLLFRIRFRNLDRVPPPSAGGVIIAINHVSHIDTVLMARLVWSSGRIPRFMIKASLFRKPVLGSIFRGAGQIPVYRGTTEAANSLRDAVAALNAGEAIVIYPEGSTTKDPDRWPMEGRTGIARLALQVPHIPVLPVGQWGAQPGGGRGLLRRPVCAASVGEPIDLNRFAGREPDRATVREVTDVVMSAIRDQVAELRGEAPPTTFFQPTQRRIDPV